MGTLFGLIVQQRPCRILSVQPASLHEELQRDTVSEALQTDPLRHPSTFDPITFIQIKTT